MRNSLKFGLATLAILAPLSQASAETIFGLTGSGTIVSFDSSAPSTITSTGTISGLPANTVLTGIDRRPNDNQLYSVSTGGTVFRITQDANGTGYTATSLGTTGAAPSGSSFGIDFNPTVDRLRLVSDTNQNLRINTNAPTGAGTIVDTNITLNGSSDVDLVGAGYTNSVFGAATTTLYGIDAFTDSLVRSTNANAGTYVNTNLAGQIFAGLGFAINAGDRVGFEISSSTGLGFFTINDGFFSVDLNTGAGARLGTLGALGITGITSAAPVPEPSTWAMMLIGFGAVGFGMRRRNARKATLRTA